MIPDTPIKMLRWMNTTQFNGLCGISGVNRIYTWHLTEKLRVRASSRVMAERLARKTQNLPGGILDLMYMFAYKSYEYPLMKKWAKVIASGDQRRAVIEIQKAMRFGCMRDRDYPEMNAMRDAIYKMIADYGSPYLCSPSDCGYDKRKKGYEYKRRHLGGNTVEQEGKGSPRENGRCEQGHDAGVGVQEV